VGAAFNFNTPVNSGHAGPLDGNAASNRVSGIGGTYTPATSIADGQGLLPALGRCRRKLGRRRIAVDDLTITFTMANNPAPPPMADFRVASTSPLAAPLLLAALSGNAFTFSFNSATGLTYLVQYSDSLTDPVWQTLQSVAGDDSVKTVAVPYRHCAALLSVDRTVAETSKPGTRETRNKKGPGIMTYRPLDESTIVDYISQRPSLATVFSNFDHLSIREVGDGNLNLVFIVENSDNPAESVVLKQALPFLRVAGESWPLTRERMRYETQALLKHNELAPGLVPAVYDFDEECPRSSWSTSNTMRSCASPWWPVCASPSS